MRIVICGGNSGIGLEAGQQLAALGNHVVLVGRDEARGRAAAEQMSRRTGKAEFLRADLSTHEGVRAAASAVLAAHEQIDALLHTTGVLITDDVRTADGLHPFFAVNFLSRYHLTQRMLPALRRSSSPRVVMMTSKVPLDTRIDFSLYPRFSPFVFSKMTMPIQVGNHHYAAHLRETEKWLRVGVVNAGVARTGIWRAAPWWMQAMAAMVGPLLFDSIPSSAKNLVTAATAEGWASGSYWLKVGTDQVTPIALDAADTVRVIAACRELTGV